MLARRMAVVVLSVIGCGVDERADDEMVPAVCGDGLMTGVERCDDAGLLDGWLCTGECQPTDDSLISAHVLVDARGPGRNLAIHEDGSIAALGVGCEPASVELQLFDASTASRWRRSFELFEEHRFQSAKLVFSSDYVRTVWTTNDADWFGNIYCHAHSREVLLTDGGSSWMQGAGIGNVWDDVVASESGFALKQRKCGFDGEDPPAVHRFGPTGNPGARLEFESSVTAPALSADDRLVIVHGQELVQYTGLSETPDWSTPIAHGASDIVATDGGWLVARVTIGVYLEHFSNQGVSEGFVVLPKASGARLKGLAWSQDGIGWVVVEVPILADDGSTEIDTIQIHRVLIDGAPEVELLREFPLSSLLYLADAAISPSGRIALLVNRRADSCEGDGSIVVVLDATSM